MLIEAAQHLDKHPGPLGHFFRKLAKRKTRNVAVVAAARKLAVIGWRMLVKNEPYRYAIPKSTEAKLAKLRVKATGQRRQGGSPKGVKCAPKLSGGSRTIKSLPEVCQSEGVPAPRELSPGEQRVVKESGCEAFVAQIAGRQVVPRRADRGKAVPAEDHAAIAPEEAPVTVSPATSVAARRRASGRVGRASCQTQPTEQVQPPGFRPPPAGEQGRSLPPPAPPASPDYS